MRLRLSSLLCLLAFCSMLTAQDKIPAGERPKVERLTNSRHISSADGLPSNQIYGLAQDADGYIWMAAANGLCRYDGYSFYNIYNLGPGPDPVQGVVGYVFTDDDKRHLWLRTSTYVYCCYDLRTGRFVDFTGRQDYARTYRRFLKGRQGTLWMFDDESGVRRVKCSDNGEINCTDYTKENGNLPVSHVRDAFEDDKGRLWAMTLNGLVMIDSEGKSRTISSGINYRRGIQLGKYVLAYTADNEIITYDENGREVRRIPVAADAGDISSVTASFVWQGKWVIMTKGKTLMVSPDDKVATVTEKYHVLRGTIMEGLSDDDNYFVSNSTGTLWIFPAEGDMRVLRLMEGVQSTTERFRRYNIRKGPDGLYYIASYGNGLFVYDLEKDYLQHYSATSPWAIVGNSYLNNILIDRSGCIWLSEESTGVTCILPPDRTNADYYYPQPERKGDWSNYVRMVTYNGKEVLLSTKDNRLYELQPDAWDKPKVAPVTLPATAYAFFKDSHGHEWMGTRGGGLYFDRKNVEFPSRQICDFTEDAQGRIWIATWGDGLFVVTVKDDGELAYTQLMKQTHNESCLHCIRPDKNGRLWIASNNGVYHIDMHSLTPSDKDLKSVNTQNGKFPFDEITCLMPDSIGNIWVGVRGGGLQKCRYDNDKRKFEIVKGYSIHEGLMTTNVFSIASDRQGNIWVGTDNGLTCIRKDEKVSSYRFGHTLESNIYSENSTAILPDGRLLFGTAYGLMILEPEHVSDSRHDHAGTPLITMVSINGDDRYLSTTDLKLDLSHDQNSIELGFSNLDYAGIASTQYRYYLEGLEHGWRQLTSDNTARYNGLPPGKYVFHLSSLNKNNQWSEECVFPITIHYPWYNTWWAWLIYLGIIAFIAYHFYRVWRRNFELHQQIRVEKELTTFRLNFFTHIAHEFRTPLAIISGAADKLTEKGDAQVSRSAVQTVRRGTHRLTKLVNQLMEFRRINTGNQRLGVLRADIVKLARTTSDEFRDILSRKEQTLTFTPFAHKHEMVFDPHLLETILYNLLSNAVKYTPTGGSISLRVRKEGRNKEGSSKERNEEGEMLQIIVEDSGPGISPQQESQLFQPFMHGYVSQGGMGIGLYTAYQNARLHKGSLTYERISPEGGSRFIVSIPADESVYSPEDYKGATAVNTMPKEEKSITEIRELVPEAFNDLTIAIIEDDPDMLDQVRDSIGRFFKTVSYTDGQSAISGIKERQPHLILCDVMLPDINGFEIVKELRTDEALRNIPVIMLTALDGDDQLLRGYKAGADDYMVKPCNYELLILRITQLIQWYGRIQPSDAEASMATVQSPTPIITDEADQRFKDKMETIVAQRMGDPDFNVDTLAALLKMGRTKFYGKMKEFTGMSPNTYLQTERLKKAAELLIEGDLNVTEVSYKVGFQSPTYFYKCFKEKYGVPPSKYGKQKK